MKLIELAELIKRSRFAKKEIFTARSITYTYYSIEDDQLKIELDTMGTKKKIVSFRIFLKELNDDWISYKEQHDYVYELYRNIYIPDSIKKLLMDVTTC
ncbi:hypothetical protein FZC66_07980 [Priestia megaterium]|nr:hypothetical protein FZC66_07980 [Priestia megaterium]